MRVEKLFKVLVVGGSLLTAGCANDLGAGSAGSSNGPAAFADAGADAADPRADAVPRQDARARADGVSSWMSWFVDPMEPDTAAADAAPDVAPDAAVDAQSDASEAGVFAWLTWV